MMPFKNICIVFIIFLIIALYSFVVIKPSNAGKYMSNYTQSINEFSKRQSALSTLIKKTDFSSVSQIGDIRAQIAVARSSLKGVDFWLRYLDPVEYKKINGPLPVEWETEVFEKFEKPYRREGAGLTLATLYLEETNANKDSLINLIAPSIAATQSFLADSNTSQLQNYHHFFLANRLFLLNLAAIYTTGFECPDTTAVIPELRSMLTNVNNIYNAFNESFPATPVTENFLTLYNNTISFVNKQSLFFSKFDHFIFIRDYINPLFKINQQFINQYKVYTKSYVDYSLNNSSQSIFSKQLYFGQNTKGIFLRVNGEKELKEIERIGKLLFYDPLLSGNNKRSCNSCHKSGEYFADTAVTNSFQYDGEKYLPRNSPSLINATYNHLLMLDGKHISMQGQAKDVISNALELGSNENELVKKILSCSDYKKAFKLFLKYTPQEKEITLEHIVSAITMYYNKFSNYYAPFDEAINKNKEIELPVKEGFNLFMSKAQCGTCHFVPQFNGVKPPYISSEFEVLGVPADTAFKKLSPDKGRFDINPAGEMLNAFRTGSLRNAAFTKPYMHNGVFNTLEQVIDFYDAGGGTGKGLKINNQTLSADSLKLTAIEKKSLIVFIRSLNEDINFEAPPEKLPVSKDKLLNNRKIGGEY